MHLTGRDERGAIAAPSYNELIVRLQDTRFGVSELFVGDDTLFVQAIVFAHFVAQECLSRLLGLLAREIDLLDDTQCALPRRSSGAESAGYSDDARPAMHAYKQ